ncbi:hypothetical protein SARC_05094 [Sphaeroforma arctica JP610]|uniref:NADH dehydrogenase [ubiquinone] 1 alpha subcomplex subunit 12 n=1 Tax=Sphaeroforma arctica JP610 TaxID=667725 RepID=A0A0L0G0N9_9EUKA|nr:hypothetical protein SARC_05094 [Sphaeroforma arctica JP610]KNC82620.1 hypothetical protein SARC_05094 [Sphaeroforma arctica JP610]|eukprot:XP_014156522.1 hypothetical protein SARC_05094 [Sphaeroforma arctica JP610]
MSKFLNRIKELGGIKGMVDKGWKYKELRTGTLIGTDANGNRYFQDKSYIFGRSRFADVKAKDPTSIAPEWHRWLHYMTDDPPSQSPVWHPKWESSPKKWAAGTGSKNEYVPFRTTAKKVHEWDPNAST